MNEEKKTGKEIYEEMAESMQVIADAMKDFENSKFTRTMARMYIKEKTKLPYRDIDKVLDAVIEFMNLATED